MNQLVQRPLAAPDRAARPDVPLFLQMDKCFITFIRVNSAPSESIDDVTGMQR